MSLTTLTVGPQQRKVLLEALTAYIELKERQLARADASGTTEVAGSITRSLTIATNLRRDLRNG